MLDDSVWEEIRNFKKCLILMFAKQAKEVIFLETVMGLAQQRRHCLIECIPLPQKIAEAAPLYFKKVSFLAILYLTLIVVDIINRPLCPRIAACSLYTFKSSDSSF